MKFTILASLTLFFTASQCAIVSPVNGAIVKEGATFQFELGAETLASGFYIDHVDVGLQKTPVSATPSVIDLATLTSSTGFSKTILVPSSATVGVYYLVAIPHIKTTNIIQNLSAANWKIYNQTFYVDCAGTASCF